MTAVLARIFSLIMLGGLAAAALVYPANKIVLGAALAAYAGLLWWRPALWLLAVPALLPVLDFAPWTGWFFLEELDLVLLASAAFGYWRLAAAPPQARLPRFFMAALALVACSFGIAAVIALMPLAPLDANSFANYNSPYNSLRIAKGLAWVLILLPLLRRSAGPDMVNVLRYFIPGMLLGLALCALAVIWERAVFPGLFNFSADYRPTAPFSAMHTGGAALDAYLAISFPFIALWLTGPGGRRRLMLALAVLLLGFYAGLATFSRDVYLAYGSSGAILVALGLGHRLRRGTINLRLVVLAALLVAVFAYFLTQLFSTSGYRGLLAALGMLAAATLASATPLRPPGLLASVAVLALMAVAAVFAFVPKGAYLGYLLGMVMFGAGALLLAAGPVRWRAPGMALAVGAFPALALGTVLVAYHWGSSVAIADAVVIVVLACAMVTLNRMPATPLWQLNRGTLTTSLLCAIVFAITIPIAGSYYTGSRFATVSSDLDVRLRHWNEAIDMMSPGWRTSAFGMGLGRYPDTYFWKNTHGEIPGSYSFQAENPNNQMLRLGTAQYAIGYGEVLRMLQHVNVDPGQRYRLAVDVRRTSPNSSFALMLCERWLLYPQNCVQPPLRLQAADGAWHRYEIEFGSGGLGRPGLLSPPVQMEIATSGPPGFIDVDNVSLTAIPGGEELVKNGSFTHANDYWFFSSDRNHFPWHVKNFAVNTYFDTGWFGVGAMALLIAYLTGSLAMRGLHGDLAASVYLAALAGFLVVGLFDSLLDVPRLSLVFFLVASVACLNPVKPPAAGKTRQRVRRVAAAAAEA